MTVAVSTGTGTGITVCVPMCMGVGVGMGVCVLPSLVQRGPYIKYHVFQQLGGVPSAQLHS